MMPMVYKPTFLRRIRRQTGMGCFAAQRHRSTPENKNVVTGAFSFAAKLHEKRTMSKTKFNKLSCKTKMTTFPFFQFQSNGELTKFVKEEVIFKIFLCM